MMMEVMMMVVVMMIILMMMIEDEVVVFGAFCVSVSAAERHAAEVREVEFLRRRRPHVLRR